MAHVWRDHPKLKGRFHPDAPDDLQVILHDGGPRLSDKPPEMVWVTVTGIDGSDIFLGRVLNQPEKLKTVSEGSPIHFVLPAGAHLLMVTQKYLSDRGSWNIHPCNKCGLDELFDAPSDLMRAIFPDLPDGAAMEMFSSFCGICGGVQVVQDKNSQPCESEIKLQTVERKWWQFWR